MASWSVSGGLSGGQGRDLHLLAASYRTAPSDVILAGARAAARRGFVYTGRRRDWPAPFTVYPIKS